MALEYADSFDTYTTAEVVRRYPTSTAAAIGSPGPGGSGQFMVASPSNGSFTFNITARDEYYIGFDLLNTTVTASASNLITIQTAAGATICLITHDTALQTTFGNSSAVFANNVWYQVQIHIVRSPTVGLLTVKVDGVTVINLAGLNTGAASIGKIAIGLGVSTFSQILSQIANLWVFNTLGSHSNGFPTGRIKVQPLLPAADGTYQSWTPNSGVSHFNRVNEAQADDDTTYNSTVASGNKDSYTIGALPGTPAQIHGVIVTAITRKTDVNSKNYQVFSKSGATEANSADIGVPLTYGSSTVNGAAALLLADDPNTSAQWTQVNLNAIEIGVKVTL